MERGKKEGKKGKLHEDRNGGCVKQVEDEDKEQMNVGGW